MVADGRADTPQPRRVPVGRDGTHFTSAYPERSSQYRYRPLTSRGLQSHSIQLLLPGADDLRRSRIDHPRPSGALRQTPERSVAARRTDRPIDSGAVRSSSGRHRSSASSDTLVREAASTDRPRFTSVAGASRRSPPRDQWTGRDVPAQRFATSAIRAHFVRSDRPPSRFSAVTDSLTEYSTHTYLRPAQRLPHDTDRAVDLADPSVPGPAA